MSIKNMRMGICTTDFEPMPTRRLFEKIRGYGYDSVQFAFGSVLESEFEPDRQIEIPARVSQAALRGIIDAAKENSLDIVAVNGTFNMAHSDRRIREEGVSRFDGFTDAVCGLGVGIVTLCTGTRSSDWLWAYDETTNTEPAYDDMMETMHRLLELAERKGLLLAVETEATNVISSPAIARRMLDEAGSDALRMVIDCANLFPAGSAHRDRVETTIREAFEAFGSEIVIAHGKDIREGAGIDFCAAGDGIVDYALFFRLLGELGYTGDMMIHGVYDEAKMVSCREKLQAILRDC